MGSMARNAICVHAQTHVCVHMVVYVCMVWCYICVWVVECSSGGGVRVYVWLLIYLCMSEGD